MEEGERASMKQRGGMCIVGWRRRGGGGVVVCLLMSIENGAAENEKVE